jgi:hypothetical protein
MRYDRTGDVRQEMSTFASQLCSQYAEYPNTVQLDRFEVYRDAGHGGAYLSAIASIGRSLSPLCFKELINFAFSLNYHWRLPRQHVFIRAILEQQNKRLADFPTTTGGPAIPIRVSNIHRFWPLWKGMTNRAVAIGSGKLLGRTVQVWPQSQQTDYPLPAWRKAFYAYAHSKGMLNYDAMSSGGLYKCNDFNAFIEHAALDQHNSSEFLDRVISVEMAMRAVGSSID